MKLSGNKLVIVESPAKARTIEKYLGSGYVVQASIGHIRDLPQPSELPSELKKGDYAKFAVDINHDFKPYYVVSPDKKKLVTQLKKELKTAQELYLATDEDREGEAIAWHLLEVLKPKVPVKRMVFHEITKEAIQRALENTRDIDLNLVEAQETRRILDRLVGYEVSPLLWRKVSRGLSAGRVQSVATRLVVERERERMAFIPAHFFDLNAIFATLTSKESSPIGVDNSFKAKLISLAGRRFAQGRDFDDHGNLLRDVEIMDQQMWETLAKAISESHSHQVKNIESKPYKRRPVAPFTTSTLQQEAGRKLRLSSRETMRIAQSLYENGYITYMRTDSTALSNQALNAARKQASELYGSNSIPASPRIYANKSKGAQEAHEAIRPAGDNFRTPEQVKSSLTSSEYALYDLIWKRTIASQMVDATGTTDTVHVASEIILPENTTFTGLTAGSVCEAEFSASGTVITNPGFMVAYEEGQDSSRYRQGETQAKLPKLTPGEQLNCQEIDQDNNEHHTSAPPRFTEASLVKTLEEKGVGRPSTYAATIGVIIDRGYVSRRGQALVPSWLAFSVTRLLEENLSELVDYDFTAEMEADLDEIATGSKDGKNWLKNFYFGTRPVTDSEPVADKAPAKIDRLNAGESNVESNLGSDTTPGSSENINTVVTPKLEIGLEKLVESLGEIDAREVNSLEVVPGISVRVGRFGPYLEDGEGNRASIPNDIAPDELDEAKVKELFSVAADDGRELGIDPASGHMIVAKNGRFGPYVTEILPEDDPEESKSKTSAKVKPRTASLFASMDLATIDLATALQLMSLPRVLGVDAEGTEITAQNGRFGPYLKKGTDSRSLESEAQIFSITLEEALAIYAQPKTRGKRTTKPPLAELGTDPVSEKPVVIKDGRFGPYITDGITNITVPRTMSVEEVTPEYAYQALADKRAKAPAKKKSTSKSTKKTTTKKATAKTGSKATKASATKTKKATTKAAAKKTADK